MILDYLGGPDGVTRVLIRGRQGIGMGRRHGMMEAEGKKAMCCGPLSHGTRMAFKSSESNEFSPGASGRKQPCRP